MRSAPAENRGARSFDAYTRLLAASDATIARAECSHESRSTWLCERNPQADASSERAPIGSLTLRVSLPAHHGLASEAALQGFVLFVPLCLCVRFVHRVLA